MVEARENENSTTDATDSEIRVHVFGRTDVGMVREHNEDSFLVADLSRKNRSIQPEVQHHVIGKLGSVFAVCDGMGGAAAGEVASKLGVDTIYEVLQEGEPPADEDALALRLNEAICEAGSRIYAESKANSARRGMGTTATVAVLINERLLFGQVGDSRAHIIRKGKLVQTTKDQSLVQQLIDANQLTPEEAKNFDRSNIILQALGTSEEVHVDVTSTLLRKGDILVICSDGLSGMVEPEDIRDVVLAIDDPADACLKLTQMACDNGGDDNVTVIIAKFDGEGLAAPAIGDDVAYEKFMLPGLDDDDSITLPRGMPAVPGSASRMSLESRTKEEQARGKLPFFIMLALLTLVAMIFFFTLNDRRSERESAAKSADTVPPPPYVVKTTVDKHMISSNDSDGADVGNAILLAVDTGMDFVGDTDPVPDTVADVSTASDDTDSLVGTAQDSAQTTDTESDAMGESAVDEIAADASSEIPDPVFATGHINHKNKIQNNTETSEPKHLKAGKKDRNSGKWASGKAKRKRKSEQYSSDDAETDISSDQNASEDTSGADVEQGNDTTPAVDTSMKKVAPVIAPKVAEEKQQDAVTSPEDTADAPSVPEDNPY